MADWNARANDIFLEAAEVDSPAERSRLLDDRCDGDAGLRAQVEALLAASAKVGSFLNQPGFRAPPENRVTTSYEPLAERPGTEIGPYRLMEQIGEGGFGLVFVAEQQVPVRRKVALKVLKPGMDSRQVLARFEAERQALALMDHQNIARILDAGATGTGRPYFVMELVHGVPITEYCDANRLTPRQRLELFVPVCHAVQHAHQKGVIHRDLKPSNILVTMYDDKAVPKVIDFGVAKATGQRLTEKTVYTQFRTLLGTFEYMSPEQAEMNALGVDTRSDVYSLGVLLYELLTGTTPLESARLSQAAFGEIVRLIKEEEPPRPSVRLSTSGALAKVAAARQTDPARLSRLVRGELDWVVMRCLEKDRSRRYETANGLARDVERFLKDEPVEACPPSAGYRLRKFARKYKRPLAVAGAFTLLLLVGLALVTWKWQDERAARAEADAAREEAEEKTREIQEGVERVNAANAAMDLGAYHVNFGRWSAAEAEYTRAIRLRDNHSQPWFRRGHLYAHLGLWDLATADFAQAFRLREPDAVSSWYDHGLLLLSQRDLSGYQRLRQRLLERFGTTIERPLLSADPGKNEDLRYTRFHLVRASSLAPGAVPGADRLLQLADLAAFRPDGALWVPLYIRGVACYRAGRLDEAAHCLRESLASTTAEARAMSFPVLAMAMHQAGQAAAARQELENARATLDRWAELVFANPGRQLPVNTWYDWVECQLLYREALRQIDNASPPEDARLLVVRGRALSTLGRQDEAARAHAEAARLAPGDHRIRLRCFRYFVSQGRWGDADRELAEAAKLRPADPEVRLAAFRAYADHGHHDRAAAAHAEAVRISPDDVKVRLERYRHYAERQLAAEADRALAEVAAHRPDDPSFHARCGDALAELGKYRPAGQAYSRAVALGTTNGQVWFRNGLLRLLRGDEKGFRQAFAGLFERHGQAPSPTTTFWLVVTGCLAPDNGVDPQRLLALFQAWEKANPNNVGSLKGLVLFRAGRVGEAIAELERQKGRTLQPHHRATLAMAHSRKGGHAEALQVLNGIPAGYRRLAPAAVASVRWDTALHGQIYYREAEALIHPRYGEKVLDRIARRDWAEAVRLIEERRKGWPDHKEPPRWVTYGNCLAELGRWKDAAAAFTKAFELKPDGGEESRALATVLLHLGDREGYRRLCASLVRRHAKSDDASLLNFAAQACVYVPEGGADPAEVLRLARKAAEANPDNAYYRRTLGRALLRAGRHAEAVTELRKTMELANGQGFAKDWLFLAMAHAHLREWEQARNYLDQSVRWMDRHLKSGEPLPGSDTLYVWEEREQLNLFRREAEALVLHEPERPASAAKVTGANKPGP